MLFDLGPTKAGLWRAEPEHRGEPAEVPIPARETIVVLEGTVRVGVDGAPHDLGTGDMLSIPAGTTVGWDASTDCKVFWIYS
jgi:quercetin dioxygenase-like cupin family protein